MKKIQIEERYKPLMELWIEDLRTHPELQGKDCLYADELYCCLGRLCSLAGIEDEDMKYEPLPAVLQRKPDIPEVFLNDTILAQLIAGMNDGGLIEKMCDGWHLVMKRYNFFEIADFLEQRIEYYE